VNARPGALRRRRKPSLVTRLRILWVFIALAAAGAAYACYTVVTLPALRVRTIAVRIAAPPVTERAVLAAAQIDRTSNVWLLDTAKIARRIEALPYVDTATVYREPPANLAIDVSVREPAACVRSGARSATIDGTRRILEQGCARAQLVEIVVRATPLGPPGSIAAASELPALLADERALRAADIAVRTLAQDRFGQLWAVQNGGIRLLFGSDGDIEEKAKLVAPVLAAAQPGRRVIAVDLRAPDTPTVQFR
jgi:cell division protein FtsQ